MKGLEKLDSLYKNNTDKQTVILNNDYRVEICQANKSGNFHHAEKTFYIYHNNSLAFTFSTMSNPAGCTTLIIYNTSGNYTKMSADTKAIILKIFDLYKTLEWSDAGGEVSQLLTIFGTHFYDSECYKSFIELGFNIISEYKNLAHPKLAHTQRLLQLLL